jgi:hypothetical protein
MKPGEGTRKVARKVRRGEHSRHRYGEPGVALHQDEKRRVGEAANADGNGNHRGTTRKWAHLPPFKTAEAECLPAIRETSRTVVRPPRDYSTVASQCGYRPHRQNGGVNVGTNYGDGRP